MECYNYDTFEAGGIYKLMVQSVLSYIHVYNTFIIHMHVPRGMSQKNFQFSPVEPGKQFAKEIQIDLVILTMCSSHRLMAV